MTTEIENASSIQQQQQQPGTDSTMSHNNNKSNKTITSRLKSISSRLTVSTAQPTASAAAASAAAREALSIESSSSSAAPYTLATDDPLSYRSHNNLPLQQQKQQQQQQPPSHHSGDTLTDDALSSSHHHPRRHHQDQDQDCTSMTHNTHMLCSHINTSHDNNDDDDDVSSTEGIDVLGGEYAPKTYSQWSRLWSGRIVRSWLYKRFILISIFVNSIIMGLATLNVVHDHYNVNRLLQDTIRGFRILFTCELILELVHYQQGALSMGWIVFDIIVISLAWFVSLTLLVLRSFRLIRALRKASGVADVKTLVKALLRVIPKMLTIIFLILLVFYIFAVIFTDLYQDLYPTYSPYTYNLHHATSSSYYEGGGDSSYYDNSNHNNRHGRGRDRRHLEDYDDDTVVFTYDYFGRLDRTAFTLFQIMTLDGWSDIAKQVMQVHPWSCLLFVAFIITTTFFFTALIIAVVGEAFHAVRDESLFKTLESSGGNGGGGGASITMSQFLLNNNHINNNSNNNSVRVGRGEGLPGKNIHNSGSGDEHGGGGGGAYATRQDVQRLEAKMDDLAKTIRHLVRIQGGMQASLQKLGSVQQHSTHQQQQGSNGGSGDASPRPASPLLPTTAAAASKTTHEHEDDVDDDDDDKHSHDISCQASNHDISPKISDSSTIATASLADVVDHIPSERNLQSHRSL